MANDFGLFAHGLMGLIVFVGFLVKGRDRFAARVALDIKIMRLGAPLIDEIGRKIQIFADLGGVVKFDQRQFNFLMPGVTLFLARFRPKDLADVVHIPHHHPQHAVAPRGVKVGQSPF